jgi:hypothetical protein
LKDNRRKRKGIGGKKKMEQASEQKKDQCYE